MWNLQCRVMKGFEYKNNATSDVDSWTLQQCEQYLSNYPNGLKADKVRARKQVLSPKGKIVTTTKTKISTTTSKTGHAEAGSAVVKVLLTILVIGIAIGVFIMFSSFFQKYHTIFAGFVMVGLVPLLKHIWS